MCGIAGILLQPTCQLSDLNERLERMAQRMQHRGPDDQGIHISRSGQVGLANRRLAIRDLSPAGHMPMGNAEGTLWITYNGEIYNAEELRSELERMGYRFRSQSDTEVILCGYAAWGKGVAGRLRGMFAFAILDESKQQLLLARDQMGIKPLYYAQVAEGIVFGSELKVVLASGLLSREISAVGLVGYLMLGSVPNPLTIYRQAQALPPASWIEIDLTRPTVTPHCYWHLPTDCVETVNYEEAVVTVRRLLADAVKTQLVSDVPLGAFLSGGLDSSTLVALMRQATSGTIRTCSMVFAEQEFSEASQAQAMAEHVGAEHYERQITAADLLHEFDHILEAMDQPSIDGVNSYFVSQTAHQAGLTVALSGLGGDELFGGYPNTFGDVPRVYQSLRRVQAIPGAANLSKWGIEQFYKHSGWQRAADAFARPASLASAYLTRRGLFAPSEVQAMVRPEIWAEASREFDVVQHVAERADGSVNDNWVIGNSASSTETRRNPQSAIRNSQFSWISRAELRTYTHHQLLRDTDVMSMAHSLEVRVPLLDVKLCEYVLRLPTHIKCNDQPFPKPLLLAAVKELLPRVVSLRTDKVGFTFPFAPWLRSTLQEQSHSLLHEVQGAVWLQPGVVKDMQSRYAHQQLHWSRLWALIALTTIRR